MSGDDERVAEEQLVTKPRMTDGSGVSLDESPDQLGEAEFRRRMRHSAAHVLAQVVLEIFPDAKLAIGPPIDTGFYYDFLLPRSLTPNDLETIERRMREEVAKKHAFVWEPITEADARQRYAAQPFKLELIDEFAGDTLGVCSHADFTDLCRGGHVEHTKQIGPFKIMNVAGAYWRGDESRPQLQRVYGALFPTEKELEAYLQRLEEAEKRDHRRLGRDLDLFSLHEEVGPGLVFWHPKGGRVRLEIEDYWRRAHLEAGYELVYTPHFGKSWLWETSGHLDFYKESMYAPMEMDGENFYAKPMNCPFHIMIYRNARRSYRELPLRLAELGTVYRYERSGTMHGLLRVRGFTQDDAHIFCTPEQVESEIVEVVRFSVEMLRTFGFDTFTAFLSTRPEKAVGEPAAWEVAEAALRRALAEAALEYEVDEGGGAFYGPKIDLRVVDALAREWQLTTVQFDFNMGTRFGLTYVGEDGAEHSPYLVHRALLGSMERFFAVLIEHYGGAFPLWLAPVQARLIPIADRHVEYAQRVATSLKTAGLRADVDARSERMNAKIRDAQLEKVPYMLVVGDREAEAAAPAVAVRRRDGKNLGVLPVADLQSQLLEEVHRRT